MVRNRLGTYQKHTLVHSGSATINWNRSGLSSRSLTRYEAKSMNLSICLANPSVPWIGKQSIEFHFKVLVNSRIGCFYLGPPEQPEFENVVMPTALDHFISRVVGDVVVFVLLEQVVGAHAIAVIQQTLSSKLPTFSINFVLAFLKKGKTSKSHVLFEMNCGTLE